MKEHKEKEAGKQAKKMIREAIVDEKHGNEFYKRLAKKLPEKSEKKMVRAIAAQEAKHRKKMKALLKDCTEKD